LKEDFELTENVNVICLPERRVDNNDFNQTDCVATGWGRESHGNKAIFEMREISAKVSISSKMLGKT
jgi:hypothetical protein